MYAAIYERRREPRLKTASAIECRLGGQLASGLMLDLSRQGAFVGPAVGWHEDHFIRATPFARIVSVGDEVLLRYREAWFLPEQLVLAELRWVGFSPTHQCYGFGFRFLSPESNKSVASASVV